jgi:hypothetical protein
MIKSLLVLFFLLFLVATGHASMTIVQCIQPDGTIEFSNKGCSKSNQLKSKKIYRHDLSSSRVVSVNAKKKKPRPFRQGSFIKLQQNLIAAQNSDEIKQHARKITDKINYSAQAGQLNAAYDMVAATYAKIARHIKNKRWQGQDVHTHTLKLKNLFESILITQSTTANNGDFKIIVQSAWQKFSIGQ